MRMLELVSLSTDKTALERGSTAILLELGVVFEEIECSVPFRICLILSTTSVVVTKPGLVTL